MTRTFFPLFRIALPLLLVTFIGAAAQGDSKKHRHRTRPKAPADSGSMVFTPEETGQNANGAKPTKQDAGGSMVFTPEETGQTKTKPTKQDAGGSMVFTPEETGQKPATSAAPEEAKPEPKPVVQAGPPTKVMERAVRLYDTDDFYASTIELHKVIEGQSGDDEGNRQRAEFYMGKALYQLKYYSAALSYFDRIVQKGAAHAYYNKTLQWLASLTRFLPESAGVLDKIGAYTRSDLEQPALQTVRTQLYYLLGRYHYSKGTTADYQKAIELFRLVPVRSEYYVRAKFFEGMTYIRQYQAKPASEAFKDILRKAADKPDKSTREFEALANLSLARTFYSLQQYALSVKYYDRVAENSPYWLDAQFESSWAHYQLDNDARALGNIHTINAPFFENELFPESLIVKATIYFQRCQFQKAHESVDQFNAIYPTLKREIDTIVATAPGNDEFFALALKIRKGKAGLSDRVQHATLGALSDKTLLKSFDYVAELDRELRTLEKADASWRRTAIAGNVLQDLTLQKSLAVEEAGGLARERLKRLSAGIQEQIKQAIKVEFEILGKQRIELEAVVAQQAPATTADKGKRKARKSKDTLVDDEHEKWPFTGGEYWKDELGYYRVPVANLCKVSSPASKTPPTTN